MKFGLLAVLPLIFLIRVSAQKNIDGLVGAEKSFAAYSVDHGIRQAFLPFADSNGIMFDKGKPVNAIQLWNSRESRPGILDWNPELAEIAGSNDFGYTTGPWTFKPKNLQDSIVASGRFITVWHVNENGDWKFLIDLGVTNIPPRNYTSLSKMQRSNPDFRPGTLGSLLQAEKGFISETQRSTKKAYLEYLSAQTLLNRNGHDPINDPDQLLNIPDSMHSTIQYIINGSGIAASGDLGYVYGTTLINNTTDNYLRIWRKEKNGWKIAVEV